MRYKSYLPMALTIYTCVSFRNLDYMIVDSKTYFSLTLHTFYVSIRAGQVSICTLRFFYCGRKVLISPPFL